MRKPPTLDELRAMPVTLDYQAVCAVCGFSKSHGYKLQKAGTFPVSPMPHSGRVRLYALADVIRYLGFDPAVVAAPGEVKAAA
ncbi:MAG: helix-turn-helix transcriptional regulator [Actinomycetes bacterium]